MTPIREFAPAKINLTLHVTGRREDGYHLLDSLVVFAGVGDWIELRPADRLTLTIDGPEGNELEPGEENLVLRAARLFPQPVKFALRLTKILPVASGIGGGSADAAATLRAICRATGQDLPDTGAILSLGADVPVCLAGKATRMQGIGEVLQPFALPADLGLVLVNPRIGVSTPAVFLGLVERSNPAMADMPPVGPADAGDKAVFADWLRQQRNDLQPSAVALAPVIADVLDVLNAQAPLAARMSGSGATCFAVFGTRKDAERAAEHIAGHRPDWWVQSGGIN